VDGYVWETLAETRPALTSRTRVIALSPDFGFPPIVAAAGLDQRHLQVLSAALQGMQHHADGRAVLAELRLDGFGNATPAMYQNIARMAREVGAL
jgi:phosphonate transport system substrate-binding protein